MFRPLYTLTRDNADILTAIPHGNYDKRLLGETSYLSYRSRYVQVTLFSARPAEFFWPCHICETAMSKIMIRTVIWGEFIWFILGDQSWMKHTPHVGINKFSFRYVIRKKLHCVVWHNSTDIHGFLKMKTYISFYQFENFNYTESSTYHVITCECESFTMKYHIRMLDDSSLYD